MNADVEKAVGRMDACLEITEPQHTVFCGDKGTYLTIRQALRDQEARITALDGRLMAALEDRRKWYALAGERRDRAERADALLREAIDEMRYLRPMGKTNGLIDRITAHLGAEQ